MSVAVRLVVVMDPIEAINPAKDSTLAILLAAQARGWQLHYAELEATSGCATASPGAASRRSRSSTIRELGSLAARASRPNWANSTSS